MQQIVSHGNFTIKVLPSPGSLSAHISPLALTDFTITSDEIKTTGEFKLEAQANFTDGTKDKVVNYNIVWYSTNSDDEITREYNEVTIEIDETGERNITASIFDINQTVTYIVK